MSPAPYHAYDDEVCCGYYYPPVLRYATSQDLSRYALPALEAGIFFLYAYRIARADKSGRNRSIDNNYLIRMGGREEDRNVDLLVSWLL